MLSSLRIDTAEAISRLQNLEQFYPQAQQRQVRFPRSKRARIRKKWAKRPGNWVAVQPPRQQKVVYDFARYLATRVNRGIVPAGYVLAFQLTIFDLKTGESGYPSTPIPGELCGYPPVMWDVVALQLADISQAVFPPEFHQGVLDHLKGLSGWVDGPGRHAVL